MKNVKQQKKLALYSFGFFITVMGIYNSVVMNSSSIISSTDARFVKRLDEVYGVTTAGRMVANHGEAREWQKIPQAPMVNFNNSQPVVVQEVKTSDASSEQVVESVQAEAAVKEELNLGLVEVANQTKWPKGLTNTDFSGNLSTNNGAIESLNVILPNGDGLSVSYSEMSGNVFEYEMSGEIYSAMMYQVDQYSYMINLTNGPLEGTRLKFAANNAEELQAQDAQALAENQNIEPGNFGEEQKFDQQAQESAQVEQQQAEAVQPEVAEAELQQNSEQQAM